VLYYKKTEESEFAMKIYPRYPGFVNRAITFSIDDGNLEMDKKFIDIVKPCGIRGTFNLCMPRLDQLSAEGYRAFYEGFEISNHVKWHPLAMIDGVEYTYSDAPVTEPIEGNNTRLYPYGDGEGEFVIYSEKDKRPRHMADAETYLRLTAECRSALEEVFGEGAIGGFVWPFGEQKNQAVLEGLMQAGYYGLRKTGSTRDTTAFALPEDRMHWSYNANHQELLSVAALYEAIPDDGTLKFFCFGVHSVDFEHAENWHELSAFAERFGNRPDTYYYATVGEIFAYEDAVRALEVGAERIYNPSALTVYIEIDGKQLTVPPKSRIALG